MCIYIYNSIGQARDCLTPKEIIRYDEQRTVSAVVATAPAITQWHMKLRIDQNVSETNLDAAWQ